MHLSILVPVHNGEDYIERCLESLLQQDIDPTKYEIVILDDGSTDNTCELVRRVQKKSINIKLYSEKNVGTYSSRNKLLALAKGNYIYCVDADDYIAYNSLGKLLSFSLENDLDMLGFGSKSTLNPEDFFLDGEMKNFAAPEVIKGEQLLLERPNHRVEVWWYFINRTFLENNSLAFEKNEFNADVVFTFKAFLKAKKAAFSPVPIYRYFQSENSIMRNEDMAKKRKLIEYLSLMIIDLCKLIEELEDKQLVENRLIINHLAQRKDDFIFFLILRMVRSKTDSLEFKNNLDKFKELNSYPIKNYLDSKNPTLKKKLLNYVINKEYLLLPLSKIYRFLN